MLGLHLAGRPLRKTDLVELSAARGLCGEPLVKLQRTVGRAGQWYDAWSACSRLRRIGWVIRVGYQYALTASGKAEAACYAEEFERIRGQPCKAGSLSEPAFPTEKQDAEEQDGQAVVSTEVLQDTEPLVPKSVQSQPMDSPSICKRRIRRKSVPAEDLESNSPGGSDGASWSVLVDTAEKPAIREQLVKLLGENATELRLPGVDYAFGQRESEDGEWQLADVLVERKTLSDMHCTLTSRRAELQARVHANLRSAGFRVALLLEGVQDTKQHPLMSEFLTAAYASHVDVLTTSSLEDTAELLKGLGSAASVHTGWTLSVLRALLQPIYEPDPVDVGRAALMAVGIARPVAETLAQSHGSLHGILACLPDQKSTFLGGEAAEATVSRVAARSGLTLYQVGKALQALGVKDAPLSRKRGGGVSSSVISASQISKEAKRKVDPFGLLMPYCDALVEVAPGLHSVLLDALRVRLQVQESRHACVGSMIVRRGGRSYLFRLTTDTQGLEPGTHWLVLPSDANWRAATFSGARAYARRQVVFSLCASLDQVARHVAACAAALGREETILPQGRAMYGKRESGLAGVLALVRTEQGSMGGFLPAEVAGNLARRLETFKDCTTVAHFVQKLREESDEWLLSLGVPDLGARRAAAVRAFLLGGA